MLTVGVIADTHIPDRARRIHPGALATFQDAGVGAILHAGDISLPYALRPLEAIAPVYSVRGNRDLLSWRLPYSRTLTFEGVTIGLTHGHAGWRKYIHDKLTRLLNGPHSFHYHMLRAFEMVPAEIDVLVFGHNHAPMNQMENGVLVFNPGSASYPNAYLPQLTPSVGLLHIHGGNVRAEVVQLPKMRL